MTQHAPLNNIDHRDLRVDTRRHASLGDDVMLALTFPAEFRNLQAHYPIVFQKTPEGVLQPVALLGLQEGRNLFLDEHGWDASYVPIAIERQPFLIGRGPAGSDGAPELMVHIDLAHPRVGTQQGEALFREQGGTTEYLDRASSLLLALHEGVHSNPAFVQALLRHDLLESFALDIEHDDGAVSRLVGFYTIHEERLRQLGDAAVAELHRAGYLEPVYMVVASISRFRDLIERMKRRHVAGH